MSANRAVIKKEPIESTHDAKCYYVVLVGRKPGIYTDVEEAIQQLEGFENSHYVTCDGRASAVDVLRKNGVPDNDIRLFRDTFKSQSNFKPDPTATFKEEFGRFAATQDWTKEEARKARVDAIRDEIIKHCLPDGVRVLTEQEYDVDDEADAYLDEDQYLEVYQAMCRTAGKKVRPTIDDSLLELKGRPYVNILDFIDTFRTGQELHTFQRWGEFVQYTKAGRRIDIEYASENDLLAPLLQDLIRGPNAVDPRAVRRRQMAERAQRAPQESRGRKRKRAKTPPVSTAELPRDLSPSVFDQDPSPSPPMRPTHERLETPYPEPGCPLSSQEEIEESDYDSASGAFDDEEIFRMVTQSSQRPEEPEQPIKNETTDDFDSDADVFDEVIKLESTQPELFIPQSSQKHQRIKPDKENVEPVSTPQPQRDHSTQGSVERVPQTPPSLTWSATSPAGVDSSKNCRTPLSPICGNGSPTKGKSSRKRQVDSSPQVLRRSKRIRDS